MDEYVNQSYEARHELNKVVLQFKDLYSDLWYIHSFVWLASANLVFIVHSMIWVCRLAMGVRARHQVMLTLIL
jgi:hypothetical protein